MTNRRRLPGVALLAVLLVAVGVVDRGDRDSLTPPGQRLATAYAPTASPPDALTSTWYCPAGTSAPGGVAEMVVVVLNPTQRRLRGAVDVVGADGKRGSRDITVESRARLIVPVSQILRSAHVAALVRLDGGGAVVEHASHGPLGEATGACASSASTNWYVPEGATTRAAQLVYALFNPFPDDAILDLSFVTEQGRDAPAAFQGVVVPANGLVALDVGTHVRRRAHVSGLIRARRGRIVVEALQSHNGDGRRGVGVMLGLPRPATSFVFPDGVAGPAYFEQLHVFNPNNEEASVQLDLVLHEGDAQPFQFKVPPRARFTLDLANESRIPKNVGHALLVQVSNGVPVAVARTIDFGAPNARRGYLSDVGATTAAMHWGFAAGGTSAGDEYISIINEAARAVTVSVTTTDASSMLTLPGLDRLTVPRGGRRVFRIQDHGGKSEMPLVVSATGPVVVERTIYRTSGTGASASMGIVLSSPN